MARIPDAEIERLRHEVSLVRLVESAGVKLARRGAEHVGLCPFHADDTPSLSVSAEKNLFHCFGCEAAGGPIDWVMKRENVQSAWLPASGDETYEIIRRRLFQTLDGDGERARDETVKAFADLYKNNPAEFRPAHHRSPVVSSEPSNST